MLKRRWVSIILLTLVLAGLIYLILQTSQHTIWSGGYWERWLVGQAGLTPGAAQLTVFYFRKTVHFCFYGSLALLFQLYLRLWGIRCFTEISGVILATVIAVIDEYYQSLVTFRSGKYQDVLLDLFGAITFTLAVAWLRKRRQTFR